MTGFLFCLSKIQALTLPINLRKGRLKDSYLREAQQSALDLPETAMVVPRDPYDVHPKNKQDFGNRLALQALKKVYGKPMVADGPFFGSVELKGDTLVVQAREPKQQLVLKIKDNTTGFEIAGPAGEFFPAEVRLEDHALYLHSPDIDQPKILRYAWGENPVTSVFNKEGMTMAPFRVVVGVVGIGLDLRFLIETKRNPNMLQARMKTNDLIVQCFRSGR